MKTNGVQFQVSMKMTERKAGIGWANQETRISCPLLDEQHLEVVADGDGDDEHRGDEQEIEETAPRERLAHQVGQGEADDQAQDGRRPGEDQ
jgi:hypothetical protein